MGTLVPNFNMDSTKAIASSSIAVGMASKPNSTKITLNLKKRHKSELAREKNSAYQYLAL